MMYLSWFFHNLAYNPSAITQADINEYVSHYSAPGGMRAGFDYYRAFPQDAIQNQNYSKTKLPMPVLALGAGYTKLGGNITMPSIIYGMKILAQNVQGITVPNSGHWIPEEQPVFLVKLLNNFFSGNSTAYTSITTFPTRFLASAIFIALEVLAHKVASTSNSPNDAVSANVPDDTFLLLCLAIHSATFFWFGSRDPILTVCPISLKPSASLRRASPDPNIPIFIINIVLVLIHTCCTWGHYAITICRSYYDHHHYSN